MAGTERQIPYAGEDEAQLLKDVGNDEQKKKDARLAYRPTAYWLDEQKGAASGVFEMMLELMHGDEILMFSTDYPHWDADDPIQAMAAIPPDIRRKIMYDNPRQFYPRVETL